MRYFIRLSYDGTNYHGWQAQKNAISIQNVLTDALSMMLKESVSLTGCGRTDAGVHAREYIAHLDLEKDLNRLQAGKLVFKLNSYLGRDIAIRQIYPVRQDAHARFSASLRSYKYYITLVKDPFLVNQSYYHYGPLDMDMMNRGAELIMKYSDFTSFSKVDSDTKTKICKVSHARWDSSENLLVFTISADRFLRNMVRAIVGTLLDLGTGKMSLRDLKLVIEAKNRSDAGDSVPACGLFLERVVYPEDILLP
ncbi:MAG: tRNA pseudouridine(38-40) synthase TruA [Bacteroidetes bacterium]|nr:tRNA pseudouridine(38-40) synthase TruA [Bacteroidota bacterium]